jgi:hypothetical protein
VASARSCSSTSSPSRGSAASTASSRGCSPTTAR